MTVSSVRTWYDTNNLPLNVSMNFSSTMGLSLPRIIWSTASCFGDFRLPLAVIFNCNNSQRTLKTKPIFIHIDNNINNDIMFKLSWLSN